jgi:hypothetical protein
MPRNRRELFRDAVGLAVAASYFADVDLKELVAAAEAADEPVVEAQSAAKRALCLAALVLRALTEHRLHPEPGVRQSVDMSTVGPDLAVLRVQRMKQEGLWEAWSVREQALLEKPLGSWQKQELIDSSWRVEDIGVLIWALESSADFPPYDRLAHETNLEANITKLVLDPPDAQPFIAHAKLRDVREIRKARDVAELWLWRARTTELQKKHVAPPEGMTFEGIIAEAARAGERDGLFKPIDNDFPALGRSYAKLSEIDWYRMRSIAWERLYALNWLCRYSDDWDHVPTDT